MAYREFDIDAYFRRIGYRGSANPDLETLRAIHALHPASIPFENIDPLLGRPVALDLASLQQKLVQNRRGGYCFEQNTLLAGALSTLGYRVGFLAARVRWMASPQRPESPRTHMLLRIDLEDGSYLADVGFGGHLLAGPLRLQSGIEQQTPASVVRLLECDGQFTLQTRLPKGWVDVYRLTLAVEFPVDFALANWFTSTHPESRFRNSLLVERLTAKTRYSLSNKRLVIRHSDGADETTVESPEELGGVLESIFGIMPPVSADQIWHRLPAI